MGPWQPHAISWWLIGFVNAFWSAGRGRPAEIKTIKGRHCE